LRRAAFQALVANLGWDDYTGRLAVGRFTRGEIRPGDTVAVLREDGAIRGKVAKVMLHRGLGTDAVDLARAGDIVVLTGLDDVAIGDTPRRSRVPRPAAPDQHRGAHRPDDFQRQQLAPSPAGRASTARRASCVPGFCESSTLNLGLRFEETDSADEFMVSGRGELHLAVLIENHAPGGL